LVRTKVASGEWLQLLGLIVGVIQAYIFAVLAAVYIAAGAQMEQQRETGAES
jgi:F-type H+-transporting ATPase subunit a